LVCNEKSSCFRPLFHVFPAWRLNFSSAAFSKPDYTESSGYSSPRSIFLAALSGANNRPITTKAATTARIVVFLFDLVSLAKASMVFASAA